MECQYCKRKNLSKAAMLSSRKCTDCFYAYHKEYQRAYQRKHYRAKVQQRQQLCLSMNDIEEVLNSYLSEKDKQSLLEQIKSNLLPCVL